MIENQVADTVDGGNVVDADEVELVNGNADDKKIRGTRFLITDNAAKTPLWDPLLMDYMVYQTEVAPTTGHVHVHCYVRMKKRTMWTTVIKALGYAKGVHVDTCRGTEKQCKAYCTKAGGMEPRGEFGMFNEEMAQGHRTDLDALTDLCKTQGCTMRVIARELPKMVVKYSKGIDVLLTALQPEVPVRREVRVIPLWGPTGTGKTHRVRTTFPGCFVVIPMQHPWDQYMNESVIFFDEFDSTKWTIQEMNQYLDVWSVNLHARYTNKMAAWTTVVIAMNQHPHTLYTDGAIPPHKMLLDAFRRRMIDQAMVINVTSRTQVIDLLTFIPTGIGITENQAQDVSAPQMQMTIQPPVSSLMSTRVLPNFINPFAVHLPSNAQMPPLVLPPPLSDADALDVANWLDAPMAADADPWSF